MLRMFTYWLLQLILALNHYTKSIHSNSIYVVAKPNTGWAF